MLNVHQGSIASLVAMLGLVVLSCDAAGQSGGPISRRMVGPATPSALVRPPQVNVERGSLITETRIARLHSRNRGRLTTLSRMGMIGAVAGAVALSTFGAFYCDLPRRRRSELSVEHCARPQ